MFFIVFVYYFYAFTYASIYLFTLGFNSCLVCLYTVHCLYYLSIQLLMVLMVCGFNKNCAKSTHKYAPTTLPIVRLGSESYNVTGNLENYRVSE